MTVRQTDAGCAGCAVLVLVLFILLALAGAALTLGQHFIEGLIR